MKSPVVLFDNRSGLNITVTIFYRKSAQNVALHAKSCRKSGDPLADGAAIPNTSGSFPNS
jgi:hypothetical protein